MTCEPIPSWTCAPPGAFGELRFVKDGRGIQRFLQLPATSDQLRCLLLDAVQASQTGHNVYFGLNPRIRRSGTNHDVCTVTALFVDIDKVGLETIVGLRQRLPPSAIVSSGHGHHLYWLLDKGYFAYETSPAAHKLCKLCNSDPVWAPAQAPRLPGTWNWKTQLPTPVQLLETSTRRYRLADVNRVLGELVPAAAPPSSYVTAVRLPKTAVGVSPALFCRLLPPKLRRVYEHYETMDRSRADMSLAVWAVSTGWSNDRIVTMLLAPNRSKLRERLQLGGMRAAQAYVTSTLSGARHRVARQPWREGLGR